MWALQEKTRGGHPRPQQLLAHRAARLHRLRISREVGVNAEIPTPNEVVLALAARAREIDTLTTELDKADHELVHARHTYEIAWAKSILTVEASNADSRKARATVATEDLAFTLRLAEHKVQSLKRAIDAKKVRIDVGRTMSAALRAEWAATA